MYKFKSGIRVASAFGLPVIMAGSASKEKLTTQNEPDKKNSPGSGIFVKASQLPIYESVEDFNVYEYHGKEKGMLQDGISVVRKELGSALEITNGVRDNVSNLYMTGKAHTISSIEYIRNDENIAARVGAIASGGLLGLIFAIRRGFFKKLIYSSVGAGGIASVCYPKEAFELSQDVIYNAGDYAAIGYNFLVGVKPQSKDDFIDMKQQVKKPPVTTQVSSSIDSSTTTTTKVQEVRKPYSLDFLAQQASDITLWGFRLKHYDGENGSESSKQTLAISAADPQNELIQTSNFDKFEVITKDVMEIIAAEAVNEGTEKVNSVLTNIADMTEKVEKISENVEKVSNFVNNSAEFVQKAVEVIKERPKIEKVTREVETIATNIGSLASEINEGAKFINTVDHTLIKINDKIDSYAEEIITDKKDEVVEETKDIIEQKIIDKQKRSFISRIFSLSSLSLSQIGDEGQKSEIDSDYDQLISDSYGSPSNPLSELEMTIKPKEDIQTNELCTNEQQSSISLDSSGPSPSEADYDNLLNMPIVVIPESQIVSDKEKSDYENRMGQIEMLEDVFINAMLRMQKQEKDAQLKNVKDKKEGGNIDDKTNSSNQDEESFSTDSMTNDVFQNNNFFVNSNNEAENDQVQHKNVDDTDDNISSDSVLKIVETDDLRYIESNGRIFKIPDVLDIQLNPDTQLMASKTDSTESSEKKPNVAKDVILKMETAVKNKFEGDIGQSNPEDRDMYTTRG